MVVSWSIDSCVVKNRKEESEKNFSNTQLLLTIQTVIGALGYLYTCILFCPRHRQLAKCGEQGKYTTLRGGVLAQSARSGEKKDPLGFCRNIVSYADKDLPKLALNVI